tara:strand:- start:159 stop:1364 length:1206 start_codon:yes stop_codon:yes gene_type:complete
LTAFDWLQHPNVQTLFAAFGDVPLRFVGGCVRDSLMGRPVADKDAATPASPQTILSLAKAAGLKAIPTGIEHGTITVVVENEPFEITTLRRDVACDGRHADVSFTDDWQEDAMRRDFTMNALYCDARGTVYDYTNGKADARVGYLRFIGDPEARLAEDGLRLLRFFRFYATFGHGAPDPAALQACQNEAARLKDISGERIRSEMLKLLAAGDPVPALEFMGPVFPYILPDGDYALSQLSIIPAQLEHAAFARLALLLRQRSHRETAVARLGSAWQLSRKQQRLLNLFVTHPTIAIPDAPAGWMPVRRHHDWADFAALAWVEAVEQKAGLPQFQTQLDALQKMAVPILPIRGGDLKQHGIPEGGEMGELLRRAERYWEAKHYRPTKMDLVHYARSLRPPKLS